MEHDARGEYRPVSRLAVAALAAGLVSALALVSPIGWVLPLVAIGLAVAALADVNRPGAPQAGGLAAVAGLALAVGFGAQAVTGAVLSRWLVERRAITAAGHWIDAVRTGRLADAMSVSAPRILPVAGGQPFDPARTQTTADAELERAFAELAAVKAVAGCGAAAAPRMTGVAPGEPPEGGWVVQATLEPCGRPQESLRIVVEPTSVARQGGSVDRWLVTGFSLER